MVMLLGFGRKTADSKSTETSRPIDAISPTAVLAMSADFHVGHSPVGTPGTVGTRPRALVFRLSPVAFSVVGTLGTHSRKVAQNTATTATIATTNHKCVRIQSDTRKACSGGPLGVPAADRHPEIPTATQSSLAEPTPFTRLTPFRPRGGIVLIESSTKPAERSCFEPKLPEEPATFRSVLPPRHYPRVNRCHPGIFVSVLHTHRLKPRRAKSTGSRRPASTSGYYVTQHLRCLGWRS